MRRLDWIVVGGIALVLSGCSSDVVTAPASSPPAAITPAVTAPPASSPPASSPPAAEYVRPGIGEPLRFFEEHFGKSVSDKYYGYRGLDYSMLVSPYGDDLDFVHNITVSFEKTDRERRSKKEALEIAQLFLPADAVEVKRYQAEVGKDVIQYKSKSLAVKTNKIYIETDAARTDEEQFPGIKFDHYLGGEFLVYAKYDDDGVFAVVIIMGNFTP